MRVTERVADEFAKLADNLMQRGVNSEHAAHFLMRLIFCLFADSIGLLPGNLFRQMVELDRAGPPTSLASSANSLRRWLQAAAPLARTTFTISTVGCLPMMRCLSLHTADMGILRAAAALDWSQVEPAIFGTLFERGLDPAKRSQLGAHHTSREDILLIVEPVVVAPLVGRWQTVKAEATALAEAAQNAKGRAHAKLRDELQGKIFAWIDELTSVRILDPACGSGNFLYLALAAVARFVA